MRVLAIALALTVLLIVAPWVAGAMAQVAAPTGAGTVTAAESSGGTGDDSAARLRRRALEAMEALREEIVTLSALREAQTALLAWNLESAKTSAASTSLPGTLCEEPALAAWCRLLPATFGAASVEQDRDGD